MRKSVLMLCCLAFAGAASALTLSWTWTSNGADWDASQSSFYMVYSQNQELTADQVVAAAAKANETTYKGIGTNWGTTLNTSGMETPKGVLVSGTGWANKAEAGTTVMVGWNDHTFPNVKDGSRGYLYLVVFENGSIDTATQFTVATAGQSGYVQIDNDGVIVDPVTNPDLAAAAQVPPVFFGGTSKAAPEPTALALLALGIAGVALRRRVR